MERPSMADPRGQIAGIWELESSDSRIGGISGLAIDGDRLLALTDGGMLVWLPKPPGRGHAEIRPLPAVSGNPLTKIGRDSEALARDPAGRGWWVAFEQRHQLILYDGEFRTALERVDIASSGFSDNCGIEAIAGAKRLRWFPERSGISDATVLADGRILLLERGVSLAGFQPQVGGIGGKPLQLPLGPLDNAEGIAAEILAGGRVRLWVVTDSDFRRWQPTRLLAFEVNLPQAAAD